MKTIFNKEITINKIGNKVVVYGWVERIRKLGKIVFINLRDSTAVIQLVTSNLSLINKISKESVIKVTGEVKKRREANPKMITGEIEVNIIDLEVLSLSKQLPFDVNDTLDVNEDTRIQYRYLDIRSKRMHNNLKIRNKLFLIIRQFLNEINFLEIETPLFTKPTPEGARDYLVPTRYSKSPSFFSLPQSPQMHKQLLMVAGIERYFQITKVFRDEDLRGDRQPEFTQLDIELSFTNPKQIQTIIENMMKKIMDAMKLKISIPFKHMKYEDALNNYGSDKPDLRFDSKLIDIKEFFVQSKFNAFKNSESVKFIHVKNQLNNKQVRLIEEISKKNGDTKVSIIEISNGKPTGPIVKFIESELNSIVKTHNILEGTIFIVANTPDKTNVSLGAIRVTLNTMLNLAKDNSYEFIWIDEWPLFEYSEKEGRYLSAHHPFTSPTEEHKKTFESNMKQAQAISYDLVLNGCEIAGGSIRINDIDIQKRIFKSLGLTTKEIDNKFGFLLSAFEYGVPPHGGIAFGLDRLLMVLLNEKSIREVIAFPKNSKGYDPLISAPTIIDEKSLDEYKLKFK